MSGKLIEISRLDISTTKGAQFLALWNDTSLLVVTDSCLQVFHLTCDLNSYSKHLNTKSTYLPFPSAAPPVQLSKLYRHTVLQSNETCVDANLCILNEHMAYETTLITRFEFSSKNGANENILAVLTSHGCVALYALRDHELSIVLNITEKLIETKYPIEMVDIKEVQSSSFCWGCSISSNVFVFVTAQRNHKIVFWKVCYDVYQVTVDPMYTFEPQVGEVKTTDWITKQKGEFILICSTCTGTIHAFNGNIKGDILTIVNSHILWPHRDLMLVNNITWFQSNDNFIIVFGKHRNLVIFLIDKECKLLNQYIKLVNNYLITSIKRNSDCIYFGTANSILYELKICCIHDALNVEYHKIEFGDDYSNYILHDIALSKNRAVWTLTATKKIRERLIQQSVTILFLKHESFDYFNALINNPSEKLTDIFDCLELLRMQVLKEKLLPDKKICELFSDPNLSTYHLKLFILLWKLYHKLDYILDIPQSSPFIMLSPDTIKETILIRHAVYLIEMLFRVQKDTGVLSVFQKDTLESSFRFIVYYCKKYKSDLTSYVDGDALEFAKGQDINAALKCTYCEEKLVDYKCQDSHPNQFCCLTLQQITDVKCLSCINCGSTVRVELAAERPKCLFCDSFMY